MSFADVVFAKSEMPPPLGIEQPKAKQKREVFVGIDESSGDKIYILNKAN